MTKKRDEGLSGAIAANILAARKASKMSQSDLAEAAGLSRSTIAQIENNRYNSLSLATLEAISKVVGVSEVQLLRRVSETQASATKAFRESPWFDALKPSVAELELLERALSAIWPHEDVAAAPVAAILQAIRQHEPSQRS